mmetsp:Transcript_5952/g.9158  ORF Transcript_5952/g.9158 Transcript_5952/m.9158 type:complete len:375 (-) Transcript_5952:27-1151(-)
MGTPSTGRLRPRRLRRLNGCVEVSGAVALVVVTGALLIIPSFQSLQRISHSSLHRERPTREDINKLLISANMSNPVAQHRLGLLYLHGSKLPQNDSMAINWLRKSANQGYTPAQCTLGVCYERGRGVTRCDPTAESWFLKAAEQGDSEAMYNLGIRYLVIDGVIAAQWFQRAAKLGHIRAQHNLATLFEMGFGVAKDAMAAAVYFRMAAEQGNRASQHKMGYIYENGIGVERDERRAAKWYRKAVDQGDRHARVRLARLRNLDNSPPTSDHASHMPTPLFLRGNLLQPNNTAIATQTHANGAARGGKGPLGGGGIGGVLRALWKVFCWCGACTTRRGHDHDSVKARGEGEMSRDRAGSSAGHGSVDDAYYWFDH